MWSEMDLSIDAFVQLFRLAGEEIRKGEAGTTKEVYRRLAW